MEDRERHTGYPRGTTRSPVQEGPVHACQSLLVGQWRVDSAPTDAAPRLTEDAAGDDPDDLATPTAYLFPDRTGRYELSLRVTDAHGTSAPSDACGKGQQSELSLTFTP